MSMGFRRKMALLMAGCLVFGSIQLTGLTVQASQTEDGQQPMSALTWGRQ